MFNTEYYYAHNEDGVSIYCVFNNEEYWLDDSFAADELAQFPSISQAVASSPNSMTINEFDKLAEDRGWRYSTDFD